MRLIIEKSNGLGAIASSICLVHCLATPFLFVAQACSASCCEATPVWWQWIDYLFLFVAFFAVYHSAQTTTHKLISKGLWISWSVLLLVVLNEKIQWVALPRYSIYFPALSLIILHIYNRKFCHCDTDQCCANTPENR